MRPTVTRLLIGLFLGAALGLAYGWLIQPVEYINTSPDSLRQDYRTDYILMVAEAYAAERDLELAQVRLAALGPRPAEEIVEEALQYAIDQEFGRTDLTRLNQLATDLRALPAEPEIGGP